MTSRKQIIANRENAKNSTGPSSESGKARSSQNATKIGVLSSVSVAEHQDQEMFDALPFQFSEDHSPQTTIEFRLVERLALLLWREMRLAKAESFKTRANQSNVKFEFEMEEKAKGNIVINRLA